MNLLLCAPDAAIRSKIGRCGPAFVTIVLLAAGSQFVFPASAAEEAHVIPPPSVKEQPAQVGPETAVLAGGCFWGVQGVFQHVKGVSNAVSGYAGAGGGQWGHEGIFSAYV
jgi:peptide-methionine (S)-S-oxide reductase